MTSSHSHVMKCGLSTCNNRTLDLSGYCHLHRNSTSLPGHQPHQDRLCAPIQAAEIPDEVRQPSSAVLEANSRTDARITALLADDALLPVVAQAAHVPTKEVREYLTQAQGAYLGEPEMESEESEDLHEWMRNTLQNELVVAAIAEHYHAKTTDVGEAIDVLTECVNTPQAVLHMENVRLAEEYRQVAAQVAQLQERAETIKSHFRDLPTPGNTATEHQFGEVRVKLTPKWVFNAGVAESVLTPKERKLISILKLDPSLAASKLPKDRYDACREQGTTAVSFS